jgi:hypothetical protein
MGWRNSKITLNTAKAQVEFWIRDLKYAVDYLHYVKSFKDYNLPNYDKIFKIASDDVKKSEIELAKSRSKLTETIIREKNG